MTLSVYDVIDQMTGYQPPAVLTAAARLGVFDVLGDRAAGGAEVAEELGTDPGATRALLDALVGTALVAVDDRGRYRAEPVAARLRHGGDLRLVAEKEAFFARVWLDLADSVRTGRPALAAWRDRLVDDPAQAKQFLEALVVLAAETGPDLVEVTGAEAGTTVADLGGGLGAYAMPLAAAGAAVTLVDLEPVAAWASAHIDQFAEAGVADRVDVRAVDLLAPAAASAVGTGFDVVLVSHLLHDLDDADALAVLVVARQLLAADGQLVVFELPGDPPGAFGPLFDLMMRVETPGAARRIDELRDLVVAAGFADVDEPTGTVRPPGILKGRLRAPGG